MAGEKHEFLKNGSNLFSRGALESGDDIEAAREIRFSAQAIFRVEVVFAKDGAIKIGQTDLPTGKSITAVVLATCPP
ncbi:MAG: hypothetical protein JO141_10650 [Bradyrhizobium sp.]|nr:hypothetical protein [Bradyrhizobium sp.]